MPNPIRQAAVAGQFYAGRRESLMREIESCYLDQRGPGEMPQVAGDGPRHLIGLVSPHAGYVYSGPVGAHGFARLARDGRPDHIVIIGPNHGRGALVSAVQTAGAWQTPLGEAPVDTELATAISEALPEYSTDVHAFDGEHSLEVQLPFLQHLFGPEVAFVPVMMLDQSLSAARTLGEALGTVLHRRDAVIIASTDMTHQEPRSAATRQDRLLIDSLLALDPDTLLHTRRQRDITMCGYGPTAAMLFATRMLGAVRAEVFRYGDSGEAYPMDTVVGYLSAGVFRA